jgi:hypothetical protein
MSEGTSYRHIVAILINDADLANRYENYRSYSSPLCGTWVLK